MTTPVLVDDTLIAEWRATGHPYKLIAAQMAEWALKQERGTLLPLSDFFAGDIGIVASAASWVRARQFLASVGVIYRTNGPYMVA
jgi:hypothetical protein